MYNRCMDELHEGTEENPTGLLVWLMRSGRLTEARRVRDVAGGGLSVPKDGALKHLAQAEEPLPLGQLAERLACVKSNATQLADRLEAERLARRTPDPADRRSIRVEITPEGRQRYAAGQEVFRTMARALFSEYTVQEREQFARLLAHAERRGRATP